CGRQDMKTLAKVVLLSIVFSSNAVNGYDRDGNFMRGGGVGGVTCSGFTSVFKRTQAAGGMRTLEGTSNINAYTSYVLGFQTGYNAAAPGVFDILGRVGGPSPGETALTWLNMWCENNPGERFAEAVVALARAQQ